MTLLLLTAALASMAFADPAVAPAIIGYLTTIGEAARASEYSGNVAQTGTITNSAAVGGDLIQYVINVKGVRIGHLWRSAGEITEDETSSAAVRNSLMQYVIYDSNFGKKIAKIVDNISKGVVESGYQAGEDPTATITNTGAVKGTYKQFSVHINGLHMTKNHDDNYGNNPVSLRYPIQTGTITNTGEIGGDLTQYIINMNDLSIDEIGRR